MSSFSDKKLEHNSGSSHKRAKHIPADAVDCTVPATVLAVRRLRDDMPLALAVHNKPDEA